VTIRDRSWRWNKTPFRGFAGGLYGGVCDTWMETCFHRWGPQLWAGSTRTGEIIAETTRCRGHTARSWKPVETEKRSQGSPSRGNLAHQRENFHVPTARLRVVFPKHNPKTKALNAA